jgi:hypothetical protein
VLDIVDIGRSKNARQVFNAIVLRMDLLSLAEFGGKGER